MKTSYFEDVIKHIACLIQLYYYYFSPTTQRWKFEFTLFQTQCLFSVAVHCQYTDSVDLNFYLSFQEYRPGYCDFRVLCSSVGLPDCWDSSLNKFPPYGLPPKLFQWTSNFPSGRSIDVVDGYQSAL